MMNDDPIGVWFRNRDKESTSLFLIAIITFFLLAVICFWGESPEQGSEQKKVYTGIRVNYQIQYGSIYTGDQTPIIYKGTEIFKVNENGLGANGLPVMSFPPACAKLPFTLNNGDLYVLYVPVDRPVAVSYAMIRDIIMVKRHIAFRTQVEKRDNQVFIRATPLTREEWKQLNI